METEKITDFLDRTPIQDFYRNQTVLITGGTGFLGKLLIEKLLRCCSDIRKIYLLVRPKKGVDEGRRFAELFKAEMFERLKTEKPDYAQKITLVQGDCLKENLGMNTADTELLKKEVTVIFHVAATVKFNESIRSATYINVRATSDLIKIAKDMPQLKAFVHVSTAYSHCIRKDIDEDFYETPLTGRSLMTLVDALDDGLLNAITPILLGDCPNTYVYTKGIAEEVVCVEGKTLPVAIVRPSIVLASYREPVPGWTDNIFGAAGIALGAALGVIRSVRINPNVKADMVPADMVVNNIVAAAWDVATQRSSKSAPNGAILRSTETPIYNFVSSIQNPITWAEFNKELEVYGFQNPSTRVVWYYFFGMRPNLVWHKTCVFFLHTIPAYLVDFILLIIGKRPMLVKGYQKIHRFLDVVSYFGMREWVWKNDNVRSLVQKMTPEDRQLFCVDIGEMNWDEMLNTLVKGTRKYILKDTEDTIPAGKRKMFILKIAHYTLMTLCVLLLYKIVSVVFRSVFSQ